tara:strand:+ start:263 stop:733 length:471 start_codon:yes stop_codon:yes gene_type:complete
MKKGLAALILSSLFSCTNNVVFQADKEMGKNWHTDSLATFHFEISDTLSVYSCKLNIRHTIDYSYQNVYVFVHTTTPIGKTTTDTINCFLADKAGKWKGKGVGNVLNYSTTIKETETYQSSGEYKIEIEQAMRYGKKSKIEFLNEILSIGVCIQKH